MEKIVVHIDSDLEDIAPGYIENRHKDVAALKEALTANDLEVPKVLGHRMKGSGAGYGFDEVTEIGRRMEEAAKAGDGQSIEALTARLEDYLARVEIVYD
ncbi:MAG: Hpt domain-containing protein [Magnetococcales bacterium]|nr:Hpt domain-containing protein [Magnetococcales bacterium]